MTLANRYIALKEQRAYRRGVAAFGLPALLAPYQPTAFIPAQRRADETDRPNR